MRDEFFESNRTIRDGFIANSAWQFIAQFARRYAGDYQFEVEQVHPGISVGGILRLSLHDKNIGLSGIKVVALEFHMDGPDKGSLWLQGAPFSDAHNLKMVEKSIVCALNSSNYRDFYQFVAQETGLPKWDVRLKPANRFAISMQFISIVQNFLSVYPEEYRPILGADKHGGSWPIGKVDTQNSWAYAYHGEKLLKDANFIGRSNEELNRLVTIKLFEAFETPVAKFVLSTSDAQLKLAKGDSDFGESVDVGNLYRKNREEFLQLAAKVAHLVTA